jgi:hypothetical protein
MSQTTNQNGNSTVGAGGSSTTVAEAGQSSYVIERIFEKPPAFGGEDGESLQQWLVFLHEWRDLYGHSESLLIRAVPTALKGMAHDAYEELSLEERKSWNAIENKLKQRFLTEAMKNRFWAQASRICRETNETVRQYASRLKALIRNADRPNVHESDKIDFFIKGLGYELEHRLYKREPKSLEDAITMAQAMEDAKHLAWPVHAGPARAGMHIAAIQPGIEADAAFVSLRETVSEMHRMLQGQQRPWQAQQRGIGAGACNANLRRYRADGRPICAHCGDEEYPHLVRECPYRHESRNSRAPGMRTNGARA